MEQMNDYERITAFIFANKWHFAKTMAYIPHWYCLLKEYGGNKEFAWAVGFMRDNARKGYFGQREFRYFYLNGYKYWDMDPTPETCDLINRDRYTKEFLTNCRSNQCDLFADAEERFTREEAEAFSCLFGDEISGSVYEIGCGGLSHKAIGGFDKYTGCTEDKALCSEMQRLHTNSAIYADKAENLYVGVHDWVVSLYGAADSITDALAAKRVAAHVGNDTRVLLMYGKENESAAILDNMLGLETVSIGRFTAHYRI